MSPNWDESAKVQELRANKVALGQTGAKTTKTGKAYSQDGVLNDYAKEQLGKVFNTKEFNTWARGEGSKVIAEVISRNGRTGSSLEDIKAALKDSKTVYHDQAKKNSDTEDATWIAQKFYESKKMLPGYWVDGRYGQPTDLCTREFLRKSELLNSEKKQKQDRLDLPPRPAGITDIKNGSYEMHLADGTALRGNVKNGAWQGEIKILSGSKEIGKATYSQSGDKQSYDVTLSSGSYTVSSTSSKGALKFEGPVEIRGTRQMTGTAVLPAGKFSLTTFEGAGDAFANGNRYSGSWTTVSGSPGPVLKDGKAKVLITTDGRIIKGS